MLIRKFDPDMEERFRLEYAARSIPFVRVSLPIAGALYLGYLFWDYAIDPSQLGYMLAARLNCVAIATLVFGLTFRPWFARFSQPILAVTAVIGAVGILIVLYLLPDGFVFGTATLLL